MKEFIIYHDVESRTTFLIIDGKLYADGCKAITFSYEGGEEANLTLCVEPAYFRSNQEMLNRLKEKGFPFNMKKPETD